MAEWTKAQMHRFQCPGHELELPLTEEMSLKYPDIHHQQDAMVRMALAVKYQRNRYFVQVPFCTTLMAEAWGAEVNYGSWNSGPRISQPPYRDISEIPSVDVLSHNRVIEVLQAVRQLSTAGEPVAFNCVGPITVLSSLVDLKSLLKSRRNEPEVLEALLIRATAQVLAIMAKAQASGARLISYADPMAHADIMGPRHFCSLSGPANTVVLQGAMGFPKKPAIHVCGKLSGDLEHYGFMTFQRLEKTWPKEGLFGHGCLNAL